MNDRVKFRKSILAIKFTMIEKKIDKKLLIHLQIHRKLPKIIMMCENLTVILRDKYENICSCYTKEKKNLIIIK